MSRCIHMEKCVMHKSISYSTCFVPVHQSVIIEDSSHRTPTPVGGSDHNLNSGVTPAA